MSLSRRPAGRRMGAAPARTPDIEKARHEGGHDMTQPHRVAVAVLERRARSERGHHGNGRPGASSKGFAAGEYLAVVAAVCLMLAGLLVLTSHRPGRTPPVRAIPVLSKLLAAPARLLRPPVVRRPSAAVRRPRRPPVRRPSPPPIVIQIPRWLVE